MKKKVYLCGANVNKEGVIMDSRRQFEEAYQSIDQKEMIVLRDVTRFPVYDQDIVSPNLMVCICHSGWARALYDMREVTIGENEIAVVMPNHVFRPLESSDDYKVTILMHSVAFTEGLKTHRITHDRFKFHTTPACKVDPADMEQFMKTVDLLEHICLMPKDVYPHRHEMLIAQTNVMTEMLNSYRREMDAEAARLDHKFGIYNEFCDLVAMHYREEHEILFYAEKLHLTTRYLSTIVKDIVGLTASDYIEEQLASQAKNMLSTRPDLTVQQIAYLLGFSESPSFCRFFKRRTGQRPKEFRNV